MNGDLFKHRSLLRDYEFDKSKKNNILNDNIELYCTKKIEAEFKRYGKYLKYTRHGKIDYNLGNYNFIILDSSLTKYFEIVDKIEKYNQYDNIEVKVYTEDTFTYKNTFDKNNLVRCLNSERNFNVTTKLSKRITNVLVLTSMTEDNARAEFEDYFQFFINLNEEPDKDQKEEKIKNLLERNEISVDNSTTLDSLKNLPIEKIPSTITKASLSAFIEKRNVIKYEDLFPEKINTAKEILAELDDMIGLEDVKKQIQELYNYLVVSKNRNSEVCKNILFLGNPRNWKNNCCKAFNRFNINNKWCNDKSTIID